jgi:glycosyltransferase involved in cell wall biosynthesis
MNILYIAEDISLPAFHGGSTHVSETINSLVELGHNVTIICKKEPKQKDIEMISKIKYIRLKLPNKPLQKNWVLFFNLGKVVSEVLTKEKIDLVWQRNRIFGNQGIIIGKKAGVTTLLEMNEPIETSKDSKLFVLIKKWFYHSTKSADKVTGTHKCMFKNIPKEKQILVHYGSNPKTFNPKMTDSKIKKKFGLKGKTVFYSGSFQPWHCLATAINAFKLILDTEPSAIFLLAGNGPQKDALEAKVKTEKIKQIFFLGNIDTEKLATYINATDVCLALFDREFAPIKKYGYFYSPIKVHDYKACGKPVIASNIGNLKNLVKENENGLLVNEQNEKEIKDAILTLFRNKKLVTNIKSNNIKDAKTKYNWKNVTKNVLKDLV